jgi:hypothetical protein
MEYVSLSNCLTESERSAIRRAVVATIQRTPEASPACRSTNPIQPPLSIEEIEALRWLLIEEFRAAA